MSGPVRIACLCGHPAETRSPGWQRHEGRVDRLVVTWDCPTCKSTFLMNVTEVPAKIPVSAMAGFAHDIGGNAEARASDSPGSDSDNS